MSVRFGKLIVFELKRGTLFREAVVQVIDYASYLGSLDKETLFRHISDRSGNGEIDKHSGTVYISDRNFKYILKI